MKVKFGALCSGAERTLSSPVCAEGPGEEWPRAQSTGAEISASKNTKMSGE